MYIDACDAYGYAGANMCCMNILQPGTVERDKGVGWKNSKLNKKRDRKRDILIPKQFELWDLQTNSRSGTMGTQITE